MDRGSVANVQQDFEQRHHPPTVDPLPKLCVFGGGEPTERVDKRLRITARTELAQGLSEERERLVRRGDVLFLNRNREVVGDSELDALELVEGWNLGWLCLWGLFRRRLRRRLRCGSRGREVGVRLARDADEWRKDHQPVKTVHGCRLLTGHIAEVECDRMSVKDLSIVRHGIAEDHNPADPSDHGRRLTELGKTRVIAAAHGMRTLGIAPDVIWTSPHLRALETANAIAAVLRPGGGLQIRESLSFRSGSSTIRAELSEGPGSVMVVGHEPILSDLASELCAHGRLRVHLKKCSLLQLSLYDLPNGHAGELLSYLPPRTLRMIGATDREIEAPLEQS